MTIQPAPTTSASGAAASPSAPAPAASPRHPVRAFWPALVWATVIFGLSSIHGDQFPVVSISIADKIVHCGVYGLLGLLCYRGLTLTTRLRPPRVLLVSVLLVLLYGISDEIHQMFVPYRSSELLDIAADVVGGVLGSALGWLYQTTRRRTGPRPEQVKRGDLQF